MIVLRLGCFCLLLALVQSQYCEPLSSPIDWERIDRLGPWHDIIDFPKTVVPALCWKLLNVTRTNYGVDMVFDIYKTGHRPRRNVFAHIETGKVGVYRAINEKYSKTLREFDDGSEMEREIEKLETEELTSSDWVFMTDYENYFIALSCEKSGFQGFVKARTAQISASQLSLVSIALVQYGINSPTMVLKNECIGQDPTKVVVI